MAEFKTPTAPYPNAFAYHHKHNLTLVEDKALENPNGTHSSLWTCSECPDVFIGDYIGTIPAGYHGCGWVQREWPRLTCENCGREMTDA